MLETSPATSIEFVHDLETLTGRECAEARGVLMELRQQWILRNVWAPFYTLGAASYIDAAADYSKYAGFAAQFNPVLHQHFGWLHQRVCEVLSRELGEPVKLAEGLAHPGFHIYLSSKLFEKPIASIHCDSQYLLHEWKDPEADFTRPISFTLPIALPVHGGGLNVWNLAYHELSAAGENANAALLNSRQRTYHPYRAGFMAMHSGHVMHQAAPGRDVQPDDERITLQGHGIFSRGAWRLYW